MYRLRGYTVLIKLINKGYMMKYSTLKALINESNRDSVEAYINNNCEHNYDSDYGIFTETQARQAVYDSYEGDAYMLGCFNAEFVCNYTPLDYDDIKLLQEAESGFEVIGKLVMTGGNFEEMMDEYIRLDGYGHALNSYDGNFNELTLDDEDYIIIRQN